MAFTKITAAGIGTTESVTLDGLSVINNGSFGGNLTVGGVLTYEDVTNVDSVGLITARNGIVVGSGITLSKDGDVFFTGIATGNGSGLTALNASNLGSGTVPTARLGSGTASSSTFLRGDSTFAAVTSTTINNNANNRLITGSGTADTLEGEANLLFDGTDTLEIGTAAGGSGYDSNMKLRIGRASDAQICIRNTSGDTNYGGLIFGDNSSSFGGGIQYHHNGDSLRFYTGGSTERLRISSTGQLLVGTTTEGAAGADQLTVASSGHGGITIRSGSSSNGNLMFSDGTSGAAEYASYLQYEHDNNKLNIGVNGSTAAMIVSSGHMGLGVTPNANWPTNNDFKALQLGTGACVFGRGSGDEDRGGIAVNYYHTGSAEKYLANGNASGMLLNDGDVDFFVAGANSSGADAAMSKTTAMRIAADADIGIGTLDPEGRLHIIGGNLSGAGSVTAATDANLLVLESNESNGMSLINANDERATIRFGTTGTGDKMKLVSRMLTKQYQQLMIEGA